MRPRREKIAVALSNGEYAHIDAYIISDIIAVNRDIALRLWVITYRPSGLCFPGFYRTLNAALKAANAIAALGIGENLPRYLPMDLKIAIHRIVAATTDHDFSRAEAEQFLARVGRGDRDKIAIEVRL